MAPTAIVIPVLEACASTERWRRTYTEDGANGMPPHVTLLYPFVDDGVLGERHVRAVAEIVGTRPPFDFTLTRFGVFTGGAGAPGVLYLAPEPETPFRELTDALAQAFSDYPPYAGAVAEVVPHLTVAWHHDAPMDEIRADVAEALPIAARADEDVAHAPRWPLANARAHRSALRTAGTTSRRRRGEKATNGAP